VIDIDLPYDHIIQQLRELLGRVERREGLMATWAGTMHRAVEDNFAAQGHPSWQELHPGTIAGRRKAGTWPGQIMQRTGQLAASVQMAWDNNSAVVGTNVAYAAIHQFGGQTKPHVTKPHVIKPKFKRALAFGGVVVRQVQHPGSKIPARPFLALTPEDADDLVRDAEDWLEGQIANGSPR
jgi:phage virion morphogenesis protein